MRNLFSVEPRFDMYILAERDWASHTTEPTYGMAHATLQRLVVACEPSDFWR
jgi:hypothetical protein